MKLGPNQKRWLKALRSGDYKQGRKALKKNVYGVDYYCCLGVMCEIDDEVDYSLIRRVVPGRPIADKWGLYSPHGEDSDGNEALTTLNDKFLTFEEIADLVETHPEMFFKHPY